ncbi:MAG: tetratricopeptide repeat protein [Kiritimatiellae bacterium]|nr:tetratricopeptide repeat protein [Kiritimatiellia bacterium]
MRRCGHPFWILWLAMGLSLVTPVHGREGPSEDERLLADGLFARGFYQMALREYERLLEAYPDFEGRAALLFRAAESARRQDRPALARRLYGEILDLPDAGGFAVRSHLRLADMAYDEQDYEAARGHAAALLGLNPPPDLAAAALHTLASASRQLGNASEAWERQMELIRDHPDDPHAAYAAMTLARTAPRESVEQRRQWYAVALRNPPSPDLEVEALWGLGMLELDAGTAEEAARQFDRLWRSHPDHPRVQTGSLTIAWALMMAERFEDALSVASRTPERRKEEQPDSWVYLEAVSFRNAQKVEEAYDRFRRLMDDFPSSRFRARAAFDLALIYAEREDHRRVIALSEDLLALPERREDALWLLAESQRALGRTEEALRRYEELAARRPVTVRSRDAAFQRALLLRRTDARAAAQALTEFAADYPADSRAFSSLRAAGTLWAEQGQPNAARRAWRLALEQHPGNPNRMEVEFSLALLELREGDSLAARTLFEALLEREPEGPKSTLSAYWLAVLAADNRDPDTETLLRKALDREQTEDHRRNLRMRLARLLESEGDPDAAGVEFMALLEEPKAPGLSDTRLVWMLRRAGEREAEADVLRIAERMRESHRADSTRELGYYALAEAEMSRGNSDEAIAAWRAGLEFVSGSRQSAEAAYALGRALMEADRLEDSERSLQTAMRRAATSEDAGLQARSMMALGDLSARREAWNEAARMYMGLAVLFEDPELSPLALRRAAAAFQRAGRNEEARRALEELSTRFPDLTEAP